MSFIKLHKIALFQIIILFSLSVNSTFSQPKNSIASKIDSLINTKTSYPFNGVILISKKGKTLYSRIKGVSDREINTKLKENDQFVVGSISKQFTAVLLLQEYDKGKVQLYTPIKKYLSELKQPWADTVTVHQLLTHTHGITSLDKPLSFKAGTQYAYSQIGYDLLAKIIEKVSGKSFAETSNDMFKKYKMYNTFHPNIKLYKNLVKGYTEQENGKLAYETETFENYVAAGGFISTAADLTHWNDLLYHGKLLKPATNLMMQTKQPVATRQHPLFGETNYGYGITIDTKENILQLGQTGFTPGFISMSFYFPKTQTSLVILDNFVWNPDDLKKTFYYHTEILKIVRENLED
jgi:D-alanyl-D-alanine carboxypeptidase